MFWSKNGIQMNKSLGYKQWNFDVWKISMVFLMIFIFRFKAKRAICSVWFSVQTRSLD